MSGIGSSSTIGIARDRWLLPVLAAQLGEDVAESVERDSAGSLWDTVIERKLLLENELVAHAARYFHMPVADLRRVSAQALELVPERWARQFGVLPLTIVNDTLVVATSNPCDVDSERALAFAAGRSIRFVIAGIPLYFQHRFGLTLCRMPQLVHTWGVIMEPHYGKHATVTSREMEILVLFAKRLSKENFFLQSFHPTQLNWLPFYWNGFTQTTHFTYVLEDFHGSRQNMGPDGS